MASKVWVQSLMAHLDVIQQTCSRLPAGERLEVEDLNQVLDKFNECRNLFLFMCELYGFSIAPKEPPTKAEPPPERPTEDGAME